MLAIYHLCHFQQFSFQMSPALVEPKYAEWVDKQQSNPHREMCYLLQGGTAVVTSAGASAGSFRGSLT